VTSSDLLAISPVGVAVLAACAVLVVDLIRPGRSPWALATAFVGLAAVALAAATAPGGPLGPAAASAFAGAYSADPLTAFLHLLFVVIVALTVLFAPDYLAPRDLPVAEFAAVLLFALSGAMLIAGASDLLVLFLGLELMVLPGYLLVGYAKRDAYSTEGAIKYFLLGSFSSAIFLFGLVFTWGLTGTTRIAGVSQALAGGTAALAANPALAVGLALMSTGVGFKIAAVPFHYWTPDAYQGSPTPVTGYLSVGPKVGAFALIIRLFAEGLAPLRDDWLPVVIALAVATMTLGNLVALTQDNVKRMLAYSSIAHTGYMLVGLAAYGAGQTAGLEGLLFYGAAYAFMNLGAFAVIAAVQKRQGVTAELATFAGLGRREPWLGVLMTLFLISLTGIPPTAGFFAKAYVILAAVQASNPWVQLLAVVAVLNAAAAAFYYLRVVRDMYMVEPVREGSAPSHGRLLWLGLAAAGLGTALLGLMPGPVLDTVRQAAGAILGA
jgi:NADH-quinone oxidoreductase subunit N